MWLGRGPGPSFGIMTYSDGIPAEPGDKTWNRGNTIGFFLFIVAQGDCWSSGSPGFPSPPPWLVTLLLVFSSNILTKTLLKVSRWWTRAYCGRCWRVLEKTEWLVSDWEGLQGKGFLFSSYDPIVSNMVDSCHLFSSLYPSSISRFFLLQKKTELSK